jgi:hypothetical protein
MRSSTKVAVKVGASRIGSRGGSSREWLWRAISVRRISTGGVSWGGDIEGGRLTVAADGAGYVGEGTGDEVGELHGELVGLVGEGAVVEVGSYLVTS